MIGWAVGGWVLGGALAIGLSVLLGNPPGFQVSWFLVGLVCCSVGSIVATIIGARRSPGL